MVGELSKGERLIESEVSNAYVKKFYIKTQGLFSIAEFFF